MCNLSGGAVPKLLRLEHLTIPAGANYEGDQHGTKAAPTADLSVAVHMWLCRQLKKIISHIVIQSNKIEY